jgi:hypothetical protein
MGEARAPFDGGIIVQLEKAGGPRGEFAFQEFEGGPAREDVDMVIPEVMTNHRKRARGVAESQGGDAEKEVPPSADSGGRRGAMKSARRLRRSLDLPHIPM